MGLKSLAGLIVAVMAVASVGGCSKGHDEAAVVDSTGKHVAGWIDPSTGGRHPGIYLASPTQCLQCHGNDLKGGISGVSCFSASFGGIGCHPQGPEVHRPGFANFSTHGRRAKAAPGGVNGLAFCQRCHGTAYSGAKTPSGISSASCVACHGVNAPHPAKPWRGSGRTHADTNPANAPACAQCHTHGQNLSTPILSTYASGDPGCFNGTLCHGVTGHNDTSVFPAPWSNPANHGAFARTDPSVGGTKGFAYCQNCHGSTFNGGAGQSCFPCHGVSAPHPAKAHWTPAAGTLSHVNTGLGNASVCANCHNGSTKNLSSSPVNYVARFAPAGSFVSGTPDCFNGSLCHADIRKTTNCNVCHGPLSATAFNSLNGVTDPADPGAGAHIAHLNAASQSNPLSSNIACGECHSVPPAPAQAGSHRNGTVDLVFGTLSRTGGAAPGVARDPGTGALVCSNTYCHGATLAGGGTNKAPRWNQTTYISGASSNGCGLCHGFPPSTPIHAGKTATDCITCHSHVNGTGSGFTDPARHINGTINISAPHAATFPGASHRTATNGTGCIGAGCHSMGTGAGDSPYPVTAGTPPNCRGCHVSANPTTDPQCSDCHGAVGDATARPNGSAAPNRNGRHLSPLGPEPFRVHNGVACSTCHPVVPGDPAHGWSGGVRKSAQLHPWINWNPVASTCTNPLPSAGAGLGCHGADTGARNWYP